VRGIPHEGERRCCCIFSGPPVRTMSGPVKLLLLPRNICNICPWKGCELWRGYRTPFHTVSHGDAPKIRHLHYWQRSELW